MSVDVDFQWFVPRRLLTEEWLRQILLDLWGHGLTVLSSDEATAPTREAVAVQLAPEITQQVAQQRASISLWDKQMTMTLVLDPSLTNLAEFPDLIPPDLDQRAYGTAGLNIDAVYVHLDAVGPIGHSDPVSPYDSTHMSLSPSYLQVYDAALHWLGTIGEVIGAAYGYGVGPHSAIRDEGGLLDDGDSAIDAALRAGRLPDLSPWLDAPAPQFVAAPYLTDADALAWAQTPGHGVTRLPGGGWSLLAPFSPSYDEATAITARNRAREAERGKHFAEALAHAQRAASIYTTLRLAGHVATMRQEIERLQRYLPNNAD